MTDPIEAARAALAAYDADPSSGRPWECRPDAIYLRAALAEVDRLLVQFTGADAAEWAREGRTHVEFMIAEDRGGGVVVCPDCGRGRLVDGTAAVDLSPSRCGACERAALAAERDRLAADVRRLTEVEAMLERGHHSLLWDNLAATEAAREAAAEVQSMAGALTCARDALRIARIDELGVAEGIAALARDRDRLAAEVAELREALRWQPASECLPANERVQVTLLVFGDPLVTEGRKTNPNNWNTAHGPRSDDGILGWRPLTPWSETKT